MSESNGDQCHWSNAISAIDALAYELDAIKAYHKANIVRSLADMLRSVWRC